ncbi:hypothetical protein Hanom_Chr05g00404061 [Helianthus anomalus]
MFVLAFINYLYSKIISITRFHLFSITCTISTPIIASRATFRTLHLLHTIFSPSVTVSSYINKFRTNGVVLLARFRPIGIHQWCDRRRRRRF